MPADQTIFATNERECTRIRGTEKVKIFTAETAENAEFAESVTEPQPKTKTHHGDTEKIKTNLHHGGHNVAEPQPKRFFTTEDTEEHEENRNQSLPQRNFRLTLQRHGENLFTADLR